MSNMESFEAKIKKFVLETAVIPEGLPIEKNTLLFEEGLFDSMGFMALINFLQEELNIQPSDDELVVENFESINAILSYITKKQAA